MYSDVQLREMLEREPSEHLLEEAGQIRDEGHGDRIGFSRKVFVPLTRLCRDACPYCTFAATPGNLKSAYLTPDEVLGIARAGHAAGCHEALFTLGDKPELRWTEARRALDEMGYEGTVDYLAAMCKLVLDETGLLPHANPGALTREECPLLGPVRG